MSPTPEPAIRYNPADAWLSANPEAERNIAWLIFMNQALAVVEFEHAAPASFLSSDVNCVDLRVAS